MIAARRAALARRSAPTLVVASLAPSADVVSARSAKESQVRSPAALEALRTPARDVPAAAPALLELAGAKTKRIRESAT